MKKRKALKEKENKWKTLKKRFKSTEIRRPHANFERSKTLDERSSSVVRSYMTKASSDDSLKDESEVESEEVKAKEDEDQDECQSNSGIKHDLMSSDFILGTFAWLS